jgi:hypothetical protein
MTREKLGRPRVGKHSLWLRNAVAVFDPGGVINLERIAGDETRDGQGFFREILALSLLKDCGWIPR